MANKIIKYNLEANGTIPTYIDDGGYFPKANSNASPQDWDLIGATNDGASETRLGELVRVKCFHEIFKTANRFLSASLPRSSSALDKIRVS